MFFFFKPQYLLMKDPAWENLIEVLSFVRNRHPKMTVGTLCTFIEIGRKQAEAFDGNLTLSDMAKSMGVAYPTLTRQTDLLGDGIGGNNGLGLIEKQNLPGSQKTKIVDITDKGIEFVCDLHKLIVGHMTEPKPATRKQKSHVS